ncbi:MULTISPECIES: M56 family metallopeptidase [Paenibacillus]|uniref:M56 family metallopeptidase n=1 Tax=Paenibacillus TaxID=44249 RepID=UPI002FE02800
MGIMLTLTVVVLSITGTVLFGALRLAKPLTYKLFDAQWHYRTQKIVLLFLLLPVGIIGGLLYMRFDGVGVPAASGPMLQQTAVYLADQGVATSRSWTNASGFAATWINQGVSTELQVLLQQIGFWLPFVWLAGLVFTGFRSLSAYRRFRARLRRTNLPMEGAALELFASLKQEMGIHSSVSLQSNDAVRTPMLIGIWRAALILPEVELDERELRLIFRHELIHYKRKDLWIKALALLANSIHWFNPAVYIWRKNLDRYMEMSCDERVVGGIPENERRFYGETILNVLERSTPSRPAGVFTGFSENTAWIQDRLVHILSATKKNRRSAILSGISAVVVAFAGVGVATVVDAKVSPATFIFEPATASQSGTDEGDMIYEAPTGSESSITEDERKEERHFVKLDRQINELTDAEIYDIYKQEGIPYSDPTDFELADGTITFPGADKIPLSSSCGSEKSPFVAKVYASSKVLDYANYAQLDKQQSRIDAWVIESLNNHVSDPDAIRDEIVQTLADHLKLPADLVTVELSNL